MTNLFNEIKKKIKSKLNIDEKNITLIDNSYLHQKHKSFDIKKFHLKIIIKSDELKKMDNIKAHREIFSILKNEMKNNIHALQIEIK